MPVESYDSSSVDSLREQISALEAQLADLKKQLENSRHDTSDPESVPDTNPTATWSGLSASWTEIAVQSVAPSEVGNIRLYRWGNETITQSEVMNIVNGLEEPYNSEVSDFIKKNDIRWLQKYLNDKIDSWEIDLAGLKDALTTRWIWLENGKHIKEDNKFGPQTLETIRFFAKDQPDQPDQPGQPDQPDQPEQPDQPDQPIDSKEREPNLDWIKEEMSDAMQDVKNRWKGNRSPERNSYDNNFEIDTARNRVILRTWWVSLRSSVKEHIEDNRCEIDWKTWDMYIYCKNNEYKMPLHFGGFVLDSKGYPKGDNVNNREKVRAFTEVWNLMNMLKAHAVFNWKWAIEYQTVSWWERAALLGYAPLLGANGIHINDGKIWWATDTLLVSERELNRLSNAYSHLWLKFDKETKVQIASLLTAMKLDLWNIRWNPDIEKIGVDPLDDEHKRWVKHYSKTYSGA